MRSSAGLASVHKGTLPQSDAMLESVLPQTYNECFIAEASSSSLNLSVSYDICKVKTHSPQDLHTSFGIRSGNGDFCPTTMVRAMFLCMLTRVVCGGMSCFAIKPLTACPLSLVKCWLLMPTEFAQLMMAATEGPSYAPGSHAPGVFSAQRLRFTGVFVACAGTPMTAGPVREYRARVEEQLPKSRCKTALQREPEARARKFAGASYRERDIA